MEPVQLTIKQVMLVKDLAAMMEITARDATIADSAFQVAKHNAQQAAINHTKFYTDLGLDITVPMRLTDEGVIEEVTDAEPVPINRAARRAKPKAKKAKAKG